MTPFLKKNLRFIRYINYIYYICSLEKKLLFVYVLY